ncbi:MAG: hypothetical protein U0525_00185 [Patescibacteria group bacterium]
MIQDIMEKWTNYIKQTLPIVLTLVIFLLLSFLVYLEIRLLNFLQPACTNSKQCISTQIFIADIIIGMTIYLKTSVDFAIFIGNLMKSYSTWKDRIAIEIGTAVGNALGTIIVLAIWSFFKEITWLLAIMIFIAALVLLKLAEEGLEHIRETKNNSPDLSFIIAQKIEKILSYINTKTDILLSKIIPNLSMKPKLGLSFLTLFFVSFTVPFILGLDDFAGYVPVFNIVNVFGFSIGVLAGHMILNLCLFMSPKTTIRVVKNNYVSLFGSIAFILLALWGFYEVFRLLFFHSS